MYSSVHILFQSFKENQGLKLKTDCLVPLSVLGLILRKTKKEKRAALFKDL